MRLGCAAGTRSIAITAACLLLFDGCARRTPPEEWGEAVNGLQCSLSCSRRTVSARRPGTLVLKVRNVGQTPARYSVERCCGPTFKVRATFEDGTSLHFADVEQQEHPCGVTDWIALRPGAVKEHRFEFVVRKFLRSDSLFVGHELAGRLERRGQLDLLLQLGQTASNVVRIKVR